MLLRSGVLLRSGRLLHCSGLVYTRLLHIRRQLLIPSVPTREPLGVGRDSAEEREASFLLLLEESQLVKVALPKVPIAQMLGHERRVRRA